MADPDFDKPDPLSDHAKKPKKDPGPTSESESKLPPSGPETFTDPSTSGGATAEDQDSATGQHTA
jgi:hypothetical protein